MIYSATITSQGQISIPASIRRKFILDKVKKVTIEADNEKIIIKPESDILKLRGIFKAKKKIPFKKIRATFGEYLAKRSL